MSRSVTTDVSQHTNSDDRVLENPQSLRRRNPDRTMALNVVGTYEARHTHNVLRPSERVRRYCARSTGSTTTNARSITASPNHSRPKAAMSQRSQATTQDAPIPLSTTMGGDSTLPKHNETLAQCVKRQRQHPAMHHQNPHATRRRAQPNQSAQPAVEGHPRQPRTLNSVAQEGENQPSGRQRPTHHVAGRVPRRDTIAGEKRQTGPQAGLLSNAHTPCNNGTKTR